MTEETLTLDEATALLGKALFMISPPVDAVADTPEVFGVRATRSFYIEPLQAEFENIPKEYFVFKYDISEQFREPSRIYLCCLVLVHEVAAAQIFECQKEGVAIEVETRIAIPSNKPLLLFFESPLAMDFKDVAFRAEEGLLKIYFSYYGRVPEQ